MTFTTTQQEQDKEFEREFILEVSEYMFDCLHSRDEAIRQATIEEVKLRFRPVGKRLRKKRTYKQGIVDGWNEAVRTLVQIKWQLINQLRNQ
jgi:hypothetical protein